MQVPIKYLTVIWRVDVRIDSLIKEIEIYDNSLHHSS
jgi:hypothetical protein